jgi:class 3 adenylate cyclase/YHS domain-containing protein
MSEQTFVFADLAGFTALTEAHGDEEAADLAVEFAGAVRSWLPEFGEGAGKMLGDGLLLRLAEPAAAIELGLAVVERCVDTPRLPQVRVGMSTGPAVVREGEWFGASVNLAARVAADAGGCEVLLTEATADAAGAMDGIELEALGPRRFRNVLDEVSVYRARRRGVEPPSLFVDPVCRMALRPDQPAETLVHEGREYRFCSHGCREAFAARPGSYLG